MSRPTVMSPWRKGRAAGEAYRAEFDAYRLAVRQRQPAERPVEPSNPYPQPVGKRGAAYANSGFRQWADGFRFGMTGR